MEKDYNDRDAAGRSHIRSSTGIESSTGIQRGREGPDDPFYTAPKLKVARQQHRTMTIFRSVETADAGGAAAGKGAVDAPLSPFTVSYNEDGDGQILETTLSYMTRAVTVTCTIDGLNTAFALSTNTCAWIEVAIDSDLQVTAIELKNGTTMPSYIDETDDVQTKLNIPVGEVTSGAQPSVPGFDFVVSSTTYHFRQILREHINLRIDNVGGYARIVHELRPI